MGTCARYRDRSLRRMWRLPFRQGAGPPIGGSLENTPFRSAYLLRLNPSLSALMPTLSGPTLTILVVACDADLRTYVCQCLQGLGAITTYEACDGREALLLARAVEPSLIVSEDTLADQNGAALCRAIRRYRTLRTVPIVLLGTRSHDVNEDADGTLSLPFNAAQLLDAVRPLVGGIL